MTNIFSNKKILVAGGTGLIGQQLVPKLINLGGKVFVASLDDKSLINNKIIPAYLPIEMKNDLLSHYKYIFGRDYIIL